MTEALASIDDYPKISSEIGIFVQSLTDVEKRSLEEISLAVFGPEVILGLEYHQILKRNLRLRNVRRRLHCWAIKRGTN